jgi:hypothetical protein
MNEGNKSGLNKAKNAGTRAAEKTKTIIEF